MSTVLVTGGSGFVGAWSIAALLQNGHQVRTTVRDPRRVDDVHAMLERAGVAAEGRLSFVMADLTHDNGWPEAVQGCDAVLHVASPFPASVPRDENELIAPARDGALRVLRASRDAGVRRVVMTSSFAAVGYGHAPRSTPFDESNWTDPTQADVQPYIKSKTLAERAAWDFIAREGGALQLAVVNPVGIFGPVLSRDHATSIGLVEQLLDGRMPAVPRIYFGVVDVRDVVDLHLRAMTDPGAAGERFIAVAGPTLSMHDVARLLRRHFGARARQVPRWQMPDGLVRLAARRQAALRGVLPQLGIRRESTADKARQRLGWTPRNSEAALIATAESLLAERV
ncbi:SDR family oxidoreductase [Solimonas marina]|uniref:Aldehyde reductase n=1 Tax=Solimonas marina TaxID=2714601 RepID=A0A969WBB8_9GAMM|nr:aldehyde reductase [Solimonas marina]NKF23029.1 aldehyde reductase [Solimonas marina]